MICSFDQKENQKLRCLKEITNCKPYNFNLPKPPNLTYSFLFGNLFEKNSIADFPLSFSDSPYFLEAPTNISSPGFYEKGYYDDKLEIIWHVSKSRKDTTFEIIMHELDIETDQIEYCPYDFLEIKSGK